MVIKKSSRGTFDAFAKPIDGITTKSAVGGVITILASLTASLLFLSQLYLYLQVDIRQSFSMAPHHPLSLVIPTEGGYANFLSNNNNSRSHHQNRKNKNKKLPADYIETVHHLQKNRMDIHVHITFPAVTCQDLDFAHDGATHSSGKLSLLHGRNAFTKRTPTEYEWAISNGRYDETNPNDRRFSKQRPSSDPDATNGCTVQGKITVPRISGDLSFQLTPTKWQEALYKIQLKLTNTKPGQRSNTNQWGDATGLYDISHYIHHITFGEPFPHAKNPLENKMTKIKNGLGLAHNSIAVKLIPTQYKRFSRRVEDCYQTSVAQYMIEPQNMAMSQNTILPGLVIHYDFTPLAVHHVESRENVFLFLSSLISIVGGVFVTVGLVSGCLVNSAAAVAKKMD